MQMGKWICSNLFMISGLFAISESFRMFCIQGSISDIYTPSFGLIKSSIYETFLSVLNSRMNILGV